jgi:excisionase family DNA binding protein
MKIGDVELMTLTEAAEYTGLSAATLRIQVKAGVIPHMKAGKLYLVDVKDLDAYVREHKGKHGFASPNYPRKAKHAEPAR